VRTASIIRPTSLIHDPDDGGSKHFWNIGRHLSEYTAQ
jgi:hypothetical protein